MAATTIGRESMTDGTTVWNVARIGSAIYDRIDTILSSNITFGGVVTSEGFGTHAFSAGGTGANVLGVRNTTAGTTNYGRLQVGNDSTAALVTLSAYSSTFTGASSYAILDATGSPGMNIRASHASGVLRFDTGGLTTRGTWDASGYLSLAKSLVLTPGGGPTSLGSGVFLGGATGVEELTAANFIATDVYGMLPSASLAGQIAIISNADAGHTYTLKHESASALSAVHRFNLPGDADVVLAPGEAVLLYYSTTISRWIACLG